MAFFDSTQLALANGLSVIFGELYEVHFTSGTRFYWDGFGPLVAYSSYVVGQRAIGAAIGNSVRRER